MRHSRLLLLPVFALLAACTVDTTGLSKDSSRGPAGNPDAIVLVEEFADLQCPACKSAQTLLSKPILEKYGQSVRFEFKHFPLRSIHRFALEAAEASECAADQGKFWEYLDVAYENQAQLSSDQLYDWADGLGLDVELFGRCVDSGIKRATILDDYNAGVDRGVAGTPTFFVNGTRVESTIDALNDAIDKELGGGNIRL